MSFTPGFLGDSCFIFYMCGYFPYDDKWALHLKYAADLLTAGWDNGKRYIPIFSVLFYKFF